MLPNFFVLAYNKYVSLKVLRDFHDDKTALSNTVELLHIPRTNARALTSHPPGFMTKHQCWYKTGHWDPLSLPRTGLDETTPAANIYNRPTGSRDQ